MYWVIFIGTACLSWLVQWNLKRKFKKYSQVLGLNGLTGEQIAREMLKDNGISDVSVISTAGQLTDHYDPSKKTVNLSEPIFANNSVMAEAVAAHECGHAIQHAVAYGPLKMRTSLVPVVSFASKWMQWVLLAGMIILSDTGNVIVLEIGIALFALTTLFAFITLPVEVDASRRAVQYLENKGYINGETDAAVKDALHAAAYTYVAAAISSLGTLLYYIIMLNRRR